MWSKYAYTSIIEVSDIINQGDWFRNLPTAVSAMLVIQHQLQPSSCISRTNCGTVTDVYNGLIGLHDYTLINDIFFMKILI